jgi:hypothetical protein
MVIFEALNAQYGDCLLLRYSGTGGNERLWIIDGGPKGVKIGGKTFLTWRDCLLPRLQEISSTVPLPVTLGMVSHIDDDHIFGIDALTSTLVDATPAEPAAVEFKRFWFNSFQDLVGPEPANVPKGTKTASLQSLVKEPPLVGDHHADLVMQSVGQGMSLAAKLSTLGVSGNAPVGALIVAEEGQKPINIEGAKLTVIGPVQKRIDALRKDWQKAIAKKSESERKAALQELFLPAKKQDKAVPNLSSIVVLVEVGGQKLLLTGDAHGDDIVKAWRDELKLGAGPVKVNLLKMPHHGSIRNVTNSFINFFEADHYVFSANGKFDNPDAPTIEAVVKAHGARKITLHFTNGDVKWKEKHEVEKSKKKVGNLPDLLKELRAAYGGKWSANVRKAADHSVVIELQ